MNRPEERVDVFGMVVGPFQENAFFLRSPDAPETVIIDPGDEGERLAALVEAHHWRPVAIVNTHGHLDHIGAVQVLKERYKVPFCLHSKDLPILRSAPEHAQFFGVPVPRIPDVDRALDDNETLELAGMRIRVLHTPGHTPGGVCLLAGDRVFAGDTLFQGSIGRTDLPGGDQDELLRSIRDRLLGLPEETIVHCGHGPDTTIGRERRTNPFLKASGLLRPAPTTDRAAP